MVILGAVGGERQIGQLRTSSAETDCSLDAGERLLPLGTMTWRMSCHWKYLHEVEGYFRDRSDNMKMHSHIRISEMYSVVTSGVHYEAVLSIDKTCIVREDLEER